MIGRISCGAILLLALASALLLGGCGRSTSEAVPPAGGNASTAVAVGINRCTTCHTAVTADWLTSKHANATAGLNSAGSPTLGQVQAGGAACQACHDPNGDSANIIAAGYIGSQARPVIGCEACHGPGSLHDGSGPISLLSGTYNSSTAYSVGTTTVSGQFLMCTNCHELLASSGTTTASSPAHLTIAPTGSAYFITDTHFATPGVFTGGTSTNTNTVDITGYVMDFAGATVCIDCHNPHKNADVNKEWALSAHAVMTAAGAWAHYNWSCDGTSETACGSSNSIPNDRRQCQRCHTTTGFAAYNDALRTGDLTTARGLRLGSLSRVPFSTGWKPEMLECRGCHTDNKGTLRNPGPITAVYDAILSYPSNTYPNQPQTYSTASFAYPNVAGSNICLACHVGRQSGQSIQNLNSGGTPTVNFGNGTLTLINGHHFEAGGVLYTALGYEFSSRDYSNPDFYMHDKIGTAAAVNTGTGGPCLGCHMSRPNGVGNHLFMPASTDELETTVTGIASQVCFQCHGPNDTAFLDMVNGQKVLYANAQAALRYVLDQRGFYFRGSSSYPLRTNTGSASISGTAVTGSGTTWLSSGVVGGGNTPDYIRIDADGTYYKIASVGSNTSLTLSSTYTGTVTSGGYTIIQSTGTTNWLTQSGTGFVPASTSDTDMTGNTTGKNNMGAAFNLNMFGNEPAAYVHNRYYTKRLIYDSIDWSDDGMLNFSTGSTLRTICNGVTVTPTPAWCSGAMSYLLPYGVLGISAERP